MARLQYWVMGDDRTTALVDERAFAELPTRAAELDLFLWIDGTAALAYKRNAQGSRRSSSPKLLDRLDNDGDLRAASARALLAVIRADEWLTPSDAVVAGSPLAARPTVRNAFVTVAKGRQAVDFEEGHERWRAFKLRRKSAASPEPLLKFAPPVELRWLVAWSEEVVTPAEAQATTDQVPRWLASRPPQVEHVGGMEVIVRDAIFHVGRDEAAVLLDVSDPHQQGPFRIETLAIITSPPGEELALLNLESAHPGPRIAVPGQQVERLRTLRVELPRDVHKPWVCVAWRSLVALGPLLGPTATREVLLVASAASGRFERSFNVEFRRVG